MMSLKEKLLIPFYMLTMLAFLNLSSLLMFWVALEINMLMFILIMMKDEQEALSQGMFYFMIQTLSSIMFMMCIFWGGSPKSEGWSALMICSVLIKAGLMPFHSWMFKIYSQMTTNSLILMVTLQKLPIFLLITHMEMKMIMAVTLMNTLAGSIFMMKSINVKELIISSSMYMTFWMWFFMKNSMQIFWLMYVIYTLMTVIILKKLGENSIKSIKVDKFLTMTVILFLLGLPPLSIFFMKMAMFKSSIESSIIMTWLIMWLSSFIATASYLKMFSKLMVNLNSSYKMESKSMVDKLIYVSALMCMSVVIMF